VIGRGRYRGVYLYEIVDQDLIFDDPLCEHYRVGNVLLFTDRRAVDLGNEFARAESLAAAREYLAQEHGMPNRNEQCDEGPDEGYESRLAALVSQVTLRDESLRSLTEKIEQRDELLRDLAESLAAQKCNNELLRNQLEQARTQHVVDELRHNELVDDLQHASVETYTIENAFERVTDEKLRLEQELAERITELVELNLQNDDLKKQLVDPHLSIGAAGATLVGLTDTTRPFSTAPSRGSRQTFPAAAKADSPAEPTPRVFTTGSGKQVHILQNPPSALEATGEAGTSHTGVSLPRAAVLVLRVATIILLALFILLGASVMTTAQLHDISYGAALDLILQGLF
jgi:hypothetical protein